MTRKKLGEILVEAGIIDAVQLRSALARQRQLGRPLGVNLVELGMVDEDALTRVLSQQLNLPAIHLKSTKITQPALDLLTADFCEKHLCIPVAYDEKGKFLDIAMADPMDQATFDLLRTTIRLNIRPCIAGKVAMIENAIRKYYYGEVRVLKDLRFEFDHLPSVDLDEQSEEEIQEETAIPISLSEPEVMADPRTLGEQSCNCRTG